MTGGRGIETPANKFATAQAVLSLAFRLHAEVRSMRLTREIFDRKVAVVTGGTGVRVPRFPEGTAQDLIDGIENITLIALGATALTADETLDEVYGNLSNEADVNRKNIRIMVIQLRNAFAHNPWRPRWRIFPRNCGVFPMELYDGSRFSFDSRALNDVRIKPEDVGGLEFWVKLLRHCERVVGVSA